MTRGGAKKTKDAGSERRCIATNSVFPISEMIRFVVSPDDVIVPDLARKLPGRGIWVSADQAALEKAIKKKLFSRAAKKEVTLPTQLDEQVKTLLADRVINLISMARKSGQAVAGFEKVKDWLVKGQAKVLIQANDGSERGKSKLATPENGEYIDCLTAEQLGVSFGRETVIHAALMAGGLASRIVEEALRLKKMQTLDGERAAGKDREFDER